MQACATTLDWALVLPAHAVQSAIVPQPMRIGVAKEIKPRSTASG